jgi:hypothetical protein
MAWSSAALASYETSDFAADKPVVFTNAIPIGPTTANVAKWVDGGTTSETDHTLSTQPARRAWDGYGNLRTATTGVDSHTWYFAMYVYDGMSFDSAFILNHNLYDAGVGGPVEAITLEIADNAAFDSNLQEIGSFTPAATRLADYNLNVGAAAQRFSGVKYVRLKIVDNASDIYPEIGELILGSRCQLPSNPSLDWDPTSYQDQFKIFTSEGGVVSRTNSFKNQFRLNAKWPVVDSTRQTEWIAFFKACSGTFVWVNNPTTLPAKWNFMVMDQEDLMFPYIGYAERTARLTAVEQGSEELFLANE